MSNFSFDCPYCGPGETLINVSCPVGSSEIEWRRHWKNVVIHPTCPCCGAIVRVGCDGVPAEFGGCVGATNVSPPRIDALSVVSGARTGGEALYILGSALDIGTLVVKFDGVPVQAVTNREATRARIVTPIGRYHFRTAANLHRVRFSSSTGSFLVGDSVQFTGGSMGVIYHIESPNTLWVHMISLVAALSTLTGQTATANQGSGPVASVAATSFLPGEGVRGLTSGSRGAFVAPLGVTGPSASFVASEVIQGGASGACALLGSPAYSGQVSVTVENEYGHRRVGGTLVGGFTYL